VARIVPASPNAQASWSSMPTSVRSPDAVAGGRATSVTPSNADAISPPSPATHMWPPLAGAAPPASPPHPGAPSANIAQKTRATPPHGLRSVHRLPAPRPADQLPDGL